METVLLHIIACFLFIIGVISIIGSITAINKKHPENQTAIETKWFKWQAPIRLVFGLICFTMIFLYTRFENSSNIAALEEENKKLSIENTGLRNTKVDFDSSNRFSFIVRHNSGKSVFKGQLLISVNFNQIRLKGSDIYDVNKNSIGNIISVNTGDKYIVKVNNSFWGLNILHKATDINSDNEGYMEIELYSISG